MAYAGQFNEHIEIWKFSKSKNSFGEVIETKQKTYECPAKVSHLSGARSVINNEVQYPYNKTFVVRIHVPINENDWIKYEDKFYRVESIDKDKSLQQTIVTVTLVNE